MNTTGKSRAAPDSGVTAPKGFAPASAPGPARVVSSDIPALARSRPVDFAPPPDPARPHVKDAALFQAELTHRIRLDGKFFRCGTEKWFVRGLTYGPFAPDAAGLFLPARPRVRADLAQIRSLGGNAIRVYHAPPRWLLDDALEFGLRVFVDVPWQKHRCFLEDHAAQRDAMARVSAAATELGDHPALFAISVTNEIPKDIVRYYGDRRIERFVRDLIDTVRQRAPDCLVTYTNFPSTEFMRPSPIDFVCFNLYLEDQQKFGAYLDRLQHLAGNAPLVLGEHGMDSLRHGAQAQAHLLAEQVRRVFAQGLAGSFVFSWTDDWFAGGTLVHDWAFGVTDRDRLHKPSAATLRQAWEKVPLVPDAPVPNVSVVVCSYNGAPTLDECLRSLTKLRYPAYEVILVDDGSTDETSQIASRFPSVIYVHQPNRGLSAARNLGARCARGEIVAYTDSDCVADEDWLTHLVREMARQEVDVIGGPNIPPPNDCDIARCVALSPGGPSHVMLDDRRAEHVPGCNFAFRRSSLLALGGFDEQFRQAGDDVDICWRFLEAGYGIGYAASAAVWHHRRSTVRAYFKQQAGYGRSEALLFLKHPRRFTATGSSLWNGVIYGEGALALAWLPPVIYHGRFGAELFPAIYRQNRIPLLAYCTLLEWHALAVFVLLLSLLFPPLAVASAAMWGLTLASVLRSVRAAPLSKSAPWWSRPLLCGLYLLQPVVRGWHRAKHRLLRRRRLPVVAGQRGSASVRTKRMSHSVFDLYWTSAQGRGREALLEAVTVVATEDGWAGDFGCHWEPADLRLTADNWHDIEVRTATEELGQGKRFTRARFLLRPTSCAVVATTAICIWGLVAICRDINWAAWVAAIGCGVLAARILHSRRACRRAAAKLLDESARRAGLEPALDVAKPRAKVPGVSRNNGDANEDDHDDVVIDRVAEAG